MKVKIFLLTIILISMFTGVVSGQSNPTEIVQSTNPSEATQEQIQTVQEWFYSEGDSLDESTRNQVGSWLSSVSSDGSGSSSTTNTGDGSEVVDEADVPDDVVAEINHNLVLRSYEFSQDEGTVTLVLYARDNTEQIVLTDPASASGSGVGTVNQQGITVNRQQTVESTFDVEFQSYTGSATVWASAGAGETIYVSNQAQPLVERIVWEMLPAVGVATALAIFIDAIIHIFIKSRKVKNEFTNMVKYIK
jgi:hypothetical protein